MFKKTIESLKTSRVISARQLNYLARKSYAHNRDVRLGTAEILGIVSPTKEGAAILQRLLNDDDEIIAAEACDSLSYAGDESCIESLIDKLNSKSEMVRGYAATAIAQICTRTKCKIKESSDAIESCCVKEQSAWVQQNYFYSLYMLGQKQLLEKLIAGYSSDSYHVRKATIEMLKNCIEDTPTSEAEIKKCIILSESLTDIESKQLLDELFIGTQGENA